MAKIKDFLGYAALALGLGFVLFFASTKVYIWDEVIENFHAHKSLIDIWKLSWHIFTPPLNYLPKKVTTLFFDPGFEISTRVFSILSYIGVSLLLLRYSKKQDFILSGFFGIGLITFSPGLTEYFILNRVYGITFFLLSLNYFFLEELQEKYSKKKLYILSLSLVLIFHSHYIASYLIILLWLPFLYREYKKKRWFSFVSFLTPCLLCIPWLIRPWFIVFKIGHFKVMNFSSQMLSKSNYEFLEINNHKFFVIYLLLPLIFILLNKGFRDKLKISVLYEYLLVFIASTGLLYINYFHQKGLTDRHYVFFYFFLIIFSWKLVSKNLSNLKFSSSIYALTGLVISVTLTLTSDYFSFQKEEVVIEGLKKKYGLEKLYVAAVRTDIYQYYDRLNSLADKIISVEEVKNKGFEDNTLYLFEYAMYIPQGLVSEYELIQEKYGVYQYVKKK